MEEMRNLIGRRNGDGVASRTRPLGIIESSTHLRSSSELSSLSLSSSSSSSSSPSTSRVQDGVRTIDDLASTADQHLAQVLKTQETVQAEVKALAAQLQEVRPWEWMTCFFFFLSLPFFFLLPGNDID